MKPSRPFPDATYCRTAYLCAHLYDCLADDAFDCPYAKPFGNSFFCKHPDCASFCHDPDKQ